MATADKITALLGSQTSCICGRTHTVLTREVVIGPGAVEQVSEVVVRHVGGGEGAVVADGVTWEVAGRRVARLLARHAIREVVLEPAGHAGPLEADETTLARLEDRLPGELTFITCVGSGTLNDLCKLAATQRGIPLVCVATAPSMNGYPSAIAAISRRGIKRTEPCQPPVAIVGDTDVLARAPAEMVQAGLGDLLSKNTSAADWLIAHLVAGEQYCAEPVSILQEAEAQCAALASAIGRREPQAVAELFAGLVLSGIAMAMAGSSSPASGGEHLISHYWDMVAEPRGRRKDLHGRQVAVASLMTLRLHESLAARTADSSRRPAWPQATPSDGDLGAQWFAHFAPLLGEEAAEEIAQIATRKQQSARRSGGDLKRLLADPGRFWSTVHQGMRPSGELEAILRRGKVPTTASDLGIGLEEQRQAFLAARFIRDRYTVLDLAADLGLLEELADAVLAKS